MTITSWSNRDAAFTNVSKGIRQVIQELKAASARNDQDLTSDFDGYQYQQNFGTYSSVIPMPVDNPLPDWQSSQGHMAKPARPLEQAEQVNSPPLLAPKKSAELDSVFVGKMIPRWNTFSLWKAIVVFAVIFSLVLVSIYLYVFNVNPPLPTTLCLAIDLPMNGPVGPTG